MSLSLEAGALVVLEGVTAKREEMYHEEITAFLDTKKLGWDVPLDQWSALERQQFFLGSKKKFVGMLNLLEKEYATTTSKRRLEQLASYRDIVICAQCDGSRLRQEALSVLYHGLNVHQFVKMSISEAREWFSELEINERDMLIAKPIIDELVLRLEFLLKVGLDYLTLDRSADTLSGGEMQRVRLASSIGSGLVGVCYVLDEPSIGLHQRDNQRLIDALRDLQQLGNSVIVVEHDEAMMRAADLLIDMGPLAGGHGGEIVAIGTPHEVESQESSLTGQYLAGVQCIPIPSKRRRIYNTRQLELRGVSTNNLKNKLL